MMDGFLSALGLLQADKICFWLFKNPADYEMAVESC